MRLTPTFRERFDAKWIPEPMSGCWLWTAQAMPNGYGKIGTGTHGDNPLLAHRAAWMLYRGAIPAGLQVCHRCDNRACVNPDHLFLGTQADNLRDMVAKGRHSTPCAKLKPRDVQEIRQWHRAGYGYIRIGRAYGVSHSVVGDVIRGTSWQDI
jgi:hypothetical protein